MKELFLGPIAIWFGLPALVGTGFFTLRTLLMLVGGADTDSGMDVGDVDAVGETGGDPADSSHAFEVLSIQAVSAFMMGFGWGGLGALRGGGWPLPVAIVFALVCGVGMVWLLAKLLRFVLGLQSSGNVPMYHALESEGTVYAQIPAKGEGLGEIRVVIGDRERFYRAITDGRALPRDTKVKVVGINDDDRSVTVIEA